MMQPARQPILSSSDGGSVHGRTEVTKIFLVFAGHKGTCILRSPKCLTLFHQS